MSKILGTVILALWCLSASATEIVLMTVIDKEGRVPQAFKLFDTVDECRDQRGFILYLAELYWDSSVYVTCVPQQLEAL